MKVLLLSPLPPPSGGIARWTERYLVWSQGKFSVELVNTALIGDRAGEAGIKKKIFDEIKRSLQIIKDTKRKLNNKPNLLHLNTSCSKVGIIRDWVCVKKAKKARVPYIVHCHCNIIDQLGNGILAKKIFKNIIDGAEKVLVLNQKSLEYVSHITAEKVVICPNFVQTEQIASSHRIRDHLERLLYVGDIRFSKGSDDLYKLAGKCPDKQFILVGSVTDEMKKLKKPENVQLLGRLGAEDVSKCLDEADAFVFPSLSEGFSNALLEAMSRGLPIIATDVGANVDMLAGSGGIIVDIHDVDAMVKAIDHMDNRLVRKNMSDSNIDRVKTSYTYDIVMQKIKDIYEEML